MVSTEDLVNDSGGLGLGIQVRGQPLETALLEHVHKVAQELVGIFLSTLSEVLPYDCVRTMGAI